MKLKFFTTLVYGLLFATTPILSAASADKDDMDDNSLLTQQHPNNQPSRVIMPAAGPRVQEGADAFLTADFLYWEARQGSLEYAQTGIETSGGGNASLPQGKVFTPEFEYDPGFRVGLGLGLGHDAWDLFVQYTWYHQNAKQTVNTHTDNSLSTLQATPNMGFSTGSPLTYADGDWKLRLNMIDLELGRDSYFSKYVALRYFIGLKAAWQNQNFDVNYKWLDTSNANAETNTHIAQTMKNFGIGLRAGLNGSWFFTKKLVHFWKSSCIYISCKSQNYS